MILIDADDGVVRVELPHGEVTIIEGLRPGTPVARSSGERAVFLDQDEARTLGKMIDYIFQKVKITQESEQALRALRPRLDELFGEAASE